jgi:hypothetical protein
MTAQNEAGAAGQAAALPTDNGRPAVTGVFAHRGDSPADRLFFRTGQLSALTAMLYGQGLENFQSLADDIQNNVLWLVHELAEEVHALADQVIVGK